MLYGAEHIVEFAKIDLGQGLFIFTMYKMLLAMEVGEKKSMKEIGKEMFTSPTMIAIIGGVVFGATGVFVDKCIYYNNSIIVIHHNSMKKG